MMGESFTVRVWFVLILLATFTSVKAETINSMAASNDWDEVGSWSEGSVPTGVETVEIQAGVTALGDVTVAADYTGNLILRSGSELRIFDYGGEDYRDFLPSDMTSTIFMYDSSILYVRHGDNTSMTHPIVVEGAVTMQKGTYFNAGDWRLDSVISGTGSVTFQFTLTSHTNREIFLTPASPSTYTGGTTINNPTGIDQRVRVFSDGAFGTGDVTIKTGSILLFSGTTDVINDSANLYIEGTGVLRMGTTTETVNYFFFDGVLQPRGTYGSSSSAATFPNDTIFPDGGTGILSVVGYPPRGVLFKIE